MTGSCFSIPLTCFTGMFAIATDLPSSTWLTGSDRRSSSLCGRTGMLIRVQLGACVVGSFKSMKHFDTHSDLESDCAVERTQSQSR